MLLIIPFKNQHPLYHVWRSMRDRCLNPNFRQWKDYGGRGISICPEWDSFAKFVSDMGPRPPKTSIDRRDNDGPYCPSNCRWATKKEQQRNQRNTRKIIIDGVTYLAADLSDKSGLKADTIMERAAAGLSLSEILAQERRIFKAGLALGGIANGARQRARTHCKHGHEFTPENTYITKEGWRNCRACAAAKEQRKRDHR